MPSGRCGIFLSHGARCREVAVERCHEDGTSFCAAHRGYRDGAPTDDLCVACEGRTEGARRDARAAAADQEVAAVRLVADPARIAALVRERAVQTSVGTSTRVVQGGLFKGSRTASEEVRFWPITREHEDPTGTAAHEVGLGLTTHGAWVRHRRPAGSALPPALESGVVPSTEGAREVVTWMDRHGIDLSVPRG